MSPIETPPIGSGAPGAMHPASSHSALLDQLIRNHERRAYRRRNVRRWFAAAGIASSLATAVGIVFVAAGWRDILLFAAAAAQVALVVNAIGLSRWLSEPDFTSVDTLSRLTALRLDVGDHRSEDAERHIAGEIARLIRERPALSLLLSGDPTTDPNG